jgi:hypothetical protein
LAFISMKNKSIFIKLNDLRLIDFYTFRMHIAFLIY